MSAESDIDAIDERVQKAAATSADGVSVQRRSVDDEIKWDRYKRDAAAASNGRLGINIFQLRMPGAADGRC